MVRLVLRRLAWLLPTLLGVTLATFALIDVAPYDRAEIASAPVGDPGAADAAARRDALARLRLKYDLVDESGAPRPLLERYGRWLGRAVRLDFAGPGEDPELLRRRFAAALPPTLLLSFLALLVALASAIPLGGWLGLHAGGRVDTAASVVLTALHGVPRFLVATLLVLFVAGGLGPAWFPTGGLSSVAANDASTWTRFADFAHHLVLPVVTLALGPFVVLVRFLRDGVAAARGSDFVLQLRALGMSETFVRRAAVRNGAVGVVTVLGAAIPGLVAGSVVVETVFAVPGLGRMLFLAILERDHPTVLALTVIGAVATSVGFLVADLLQAALDPRVAR
jgi:peptide/nickel transport system permease protein